MDMRKHLKGRLLGILAAVMTFSVLNPSIASADMGNYNFVSIESEVVDSITVNGVTVEARYKPYGAGYDTDSTYCCAALVQRFYSQVYGRNVSNLKRTTSVPYIDQGSFSETAAPKVGDVLRDNYSAHWAIVKEINGNTVTLIQQNAWNGSYTKAWVGGDGTDRGPALYLLYLGRQSADGGSRNRCRELCDRIYGSGDRSDKRRGTRQGQQSKPCAVDPGGLQALGR